MGLDKNIKEKRDNFGLVNNKILDGLLEFYGSYPLFNNQLDSVTERIKWLESKPDNGELYYTLTNKINDAFLESKEAKIESINRFGTIKDKLDRVKEEYDKEVKSLDYDSGCVTHKLVKVYNSIDDLQTDNNKEILGKEVRRYYRRYGSFKYK